MTKDEEIRAGLLGSGVPDMVLRTTLCKEGAHDLRGIVSGKVLDGQEARGLYVYPKNKNSVMRARRLFYLTAKELFLSGTTVCCLPLTRLMSAITTEDFVGEASRVERVRMVFATDFYEEGAGFPFSTHDSAKLRAWVRQKFELGSAVCFLADADLDHCTSWWPQSFTGFIADHSLVYQVQ